MNRDTRLQSGHIAYEQHRLGNGLTVVCSCDRYAPLTTFNMVYGVGARNETSERTGFAHLFEHLMFGGSQHVADFDKAASNAAADTNAFTTNDLTNYYITLPSANLETAFWLESDRLLAPLLGKEQLDVQRQVVVEEFKERYLNRPYGTVGHLLRALCYKRHPYRWPTIGLRPEHIERATEAEVRSFFARNYSPDNAYLAVCGNVESERVFGLAEKWFGDIERHASQSLPEAEPEQTAPRRQEVTMAVPASRVMIAWHMEGRLHRDYHLANVATDLLAEGDSSRLVQRLVQLERTATNVDAGIQGSFDPGLITLSASVASGVSTGTVERQLLEEMERLCTTAPGEAELRKVRNRLEASLVFGLASSETRAQALAKGAMLGNADLINQELSQYEDIEPEQLRAYLARTCRRDNSCTLIVHAEAN